MSEHWREILPVDRYIVRSNGVINEFDRRVLMMLYQPLLGAPSLSLYMTLWSELEVNQVWSEERTHHSLMSLMQQNLKQIFEDRKKLEGIGLLKTYVSEEEQSKHFVYELQPPLQPKDFFDDGVLNIYLYNRLGKTNFHKVRSYFTASILDKEKYKAVTHSFDEVFSSIHPSELTAQINSELRQELESPTGKEYISQQNPEGLSIAFPNFDFSVLEAGLSDTLVPKKALTDEIRELIKKLAYVYQVNPIEMRNILLTALDPVNEYIDRDELRKAARDWYQFEHGEALPSLSSKTQPMFHRTMEGVKPSTKEEELMKVLELVSPYQLLKDISGGAEPAVSDLQIVEEVMLQQKLSPGVVNVLIYYVMLKSDMKLSKNYATKIAAHWARKNINTVPQAMNLAREEHKKYQDWVPKQTKKRTGQKGKPIREEMLPDWLQKKDEKSEENPVEQQSLGKFEQERKKTEALLLKYKRKQP